jgi:RluA family pseudouridine synthase
VSPRRETLPVPALAAGERLDLWLAAALGVSRKAVKKALDGGQLFIDGRCERRAGMSLRGGETVVITVEAPAAASVAPAFSILYRDEQLLAIDKPAGLPAHPTVAGRCNALDLVANRLREEGFTSAPILLHRLDADTTGILLFALTAAANRSLYRQFVEHRIEKVYLALVAGSPPDAFGVTNFLRPGRRGRMEAVHAGGQQAETAFRTVRHSAGYALVEARPKTGRTHQIRVHLAGAGYPLLGDTLYGGPTAIAVAGRVLPLPRHLLHACRLTFRHPASGEGITLEAPLPDDFRLLLTT